MKKNIYIPVITGTEKKVFVNRPSEPVSSTQFVASDPWGEPAAAAFFNTRTYLGEEH